MPANVRKAEIDVRRGSLIRELDQNEALNERDDVNKQDRKPSMQGPEAQQITTTEPEPLPNESVPSEFRRVEFFVSGTVPVAKYSSQPDQQVEYDPETGEPIEHPTPTPKPTPVSGTWEDGMGPPDNDGETSNRKPAKNEMISVTICPLTGMRATSNCPERERRTFRRGMEPRDFCTFHVNPPK